MDAAIWKGLANTLLKLPLPAEAGRALLYYLYGLLGRPEERTFFSSSVLDALAGATKERFRTTIPLAIGWLQTGHVGQITSTQDLPNALIASDSELVTLLNQERTLLYLAANSHLTIQSWPLYTQREAHTLSGEMFPISVNISYNGRYFRNAKFVALAEEEEYYNALSDHDIRKLIDIIQENSAKQTDYDGLLDEVDLIRKELERPKNSGVRRAALRFLATAGRAARDGYIGNTATDLGNKLVEIITT